MGGIKMLRNLMISLLFLSVGTIEAADNETISLSVGEWPPYFSSSLPYGGLIPHLVSEALSEQGIDVKFSYFEWNEALNEYLRGTFDGSLGWFKTQEREAISQYSVPLAYSTLVFFHLADRKFTWEQPSDYGQFTLGQVNGYSYGKVLDHSISDGTLKTKLYDTELDAFNALIEKEIDLLPTDREVGTYIISQWPPDLRERVKYDEHILSREPFYLIAKKDSPKATQMVSYFNAGLKTIQASGQYQNIVTNLNLINEASKLVLLSENIPPLSYVTRGGEVRGLAANIMTNLLQELGLPERDVKYLFVPWARGYHQLLNDAQNVLFPMTKTEEREPLFQWVGPFYRSNIVLYGRKGEFSNVERLADVHDQIICAVREDVGSQTLRTMNFPVEHIVEVNLPRQCALMLVNGRVSFWAYGRDTALWHFTDTKLNPENFIEVMQLRESERYFAFNRSVHPEVVKAFQARLDYMRISGTLDGIIETELAHH